MYMITNPTSGDTLLLRVCARGRFGVELLLLLDADATGLSSSPQTGSSVFFIQPISLTISVLVFFSSFKVCLSNVASLLWLSHVHHFSVVLIVCLGPCLLFSFP